MLISCGLLLLAFIVFSPYIPYNISYKVNDTATQTIVSPRFLQFESHEDKLRTQSLQQEKAGFVAPVYEIDPMTTQAVMSNLQYLFTVISDFRQNQNPNAPTPIPRELRYLSHKDIVLLLELNDAQFSYLKYAALQNTEKMLQLGVQELQWPELKTRFLSSLASVDMESQLKSLMFTLIRPYLKVNMLYNEALTQAAIQTAKQSVPRIVTTFREGEPIIYKGETVTPEHIAVFHALNLYGRKASLFKFFGILLSSLLLFLLIERFIYYFTHWVYEKRKFFVLIYLIVLIVVLLARLLYQTPASVPWLDMRLLIPNPLAAMLLAVLITPHISMLCGTVIAFLVAMMYGFNLHLMLYLFFGAAVTTFATYRQTTRHHIITAGYVVGFFNVIMALTLGMLLEMTSPMWFVVNAVAAFFNGILSAMITLAILPYLENLFRITTNQTLLELSNLNHPLLKRLMLQAPGTYQHSLMVANLAEAAAETIGANSVLARVSAYFHDVGKLKRPIFFSENQFSIENPHNTLTPRMSKIIISSHVKDGLVLLQKYKLPSILQDCIVEHHGTSLVSFFYSQALHLEKNDTPVVTSKEEFRYPGPKPKTKVVGILMLADAVEASVKALEKPSVNKIEAVIDKIFQEKLDDKQLDECPLSLAELDTIRITFLNIFKGMYHHRLDYQLELAQIVEQNKLKKNGT